ncbi:MULTISPECIES: DUF3899 domain-containing protein [Bacillus]|uniref:DUF3899 domain-containing protein n=1 Tax=Bacillus TaxID=1386 RepID=UPI0012FF37A6|nr:MULTISPECIES: DUF3899 domain-containing protein [Bacillus]
MNVKKIIIQFLILLLLTILISLLYYKEISLLTLINTSFVLSSVIIFTTLLLFVTQKGFFDGISYGFRKIFATSQADKDLERDISTLRPPSELVAPIQAANVMYSSLLLFVLMLIGVFMFYL